MGCERKNSPDRSSSPCPSHVETCPSRHDSGVASMASMWNASAARPHAAGLHLAAQRIAIDLNRWQTLFGFLPLFSPPLLPALQAARPLQELADPLLAPLGAVFARQLRLGLWRLLPPNGCCALRLAWARLASRPAGERHVEPVLSAIPALRPRRAVVVIVLARRKQLLGFESELIIGCVASIATLLARSQHIRRVGTALASDCPVAAMRVLVFTWRPRLRFRFEPEARFLQLCNVPLNFLAARVLCP